MRERERVREIERGIPSVNSLSSVFFPSSLLDHSFHLYRQTTYLKIGKKILQTEEGERKKERKKEKEDRLKIPVFKKRKNDSSDSDF